MAKFGIEERVEEMVVHGRSPLLLAEGEEVWIGGGKGGSGSPGLSGRELEEIGWRNDVRRMTYQDAIMNVRNLI